MYSVPNEVLEAFNCVGTPIRLQGGEGNAFLLENVVFKPIQSAERYEWASEILLRIPQTGFRISMPRKNIHGKFMHAGWGATDYQRGEPIYGRWVEKLSVCRAFHTALQGLSVKPMPPSSDRWTRAHEIAWREAGLPQSIHIEIRQLIYSLFQKYRSLERSRQLIHSDLCGNILFDDQLSPLVIDFSPAYGSKEYAEAILVADAIAWESAPIELLREIPETEDYLQLLLRAVNFRLIVAALFYPMDVALFKREYGDFEPLLRRFF